METNRAFPPSQTFNHSIQLLAPFSPLEPCKQLQILSDNFRFLTPLPRGFKFYLQSIRIDCKKEIHTNLPLAPSSFSLHQNRANPSSQCPIKTESLILNSIPFENINIPSSSNIQETQCWRVQNRPRSTLSSAHLSTGSECSRRRCIGASCMGSSPSMASARGLEVPCARWRPITTGRMCREWCRPRLKCIRG